MTAKPQPAEFRLEVSYQLAEYKQLLRDYVALELRSTGKRHSIWSPWNWRVVQDACFALFVPLLFRWKVARVGHCTFTFNADGLTRTSKSGAASRSWAQVACVHRLSNAYLVELVEGGALPLPLRVFTDLQRAQFDLWVTDAGCWAQLSASRE